MPKETPGPTKQEPEREELDEARKKKKSLGTLPKGGMSPLADREDPGAWTASRAPLDARDVRVSPLGGDRRSEQGEPTGGWVEASSGLGRIRVGRDASDDQEAGPRQQLWEGTPEFKDEEASDLASRRASGRPRARAVRRIRKQRAAAEDAARERQEEDRNYQDAVKDMEADGEEYDDLES